jgi:hypothetical protein
MVAAARAEAVALDIAGAAILIVALVDMFLTIFNYDGYTTAATLFHRAWWRGVRAVAQPLPVRARRIALSIGSASMLPATVALWLSLEITAFALLFDSALGGGAFRLKDATASIGTAYYLSAGAISSLSFGDVIATGGLDRALVDLETIIGLATFTLALSYIVTAFGVLGSLENLHGRVRRHASDVERPESIVCRHFRGGQSGDLPSFLQALSDDLEKYDQGLRRYPVVYYFHTRETNRSIPHVFTSIGDLIALLRWGLPATDPMTGDAFLYALHDGYGETLERLRRSFVGPDPIALPKVLSHDAFTAAYLRRATDPTVEQFRTLQEHGRNAAGTGDEQDDAATAYNRYLEWLPFAHRQRVVLDRVADRLGYERPTPVASPTPPPLSNGESQAPLRSGPS